MAHVSEVSGEDRAAVLVTGAGKRLGRVIALALARAGYPVGVHYGGSHQEALATVAAIQAAGGRAVALKADLQDEAAVSALLPALADALGEPLGVVNSASRFEFDDAASLGYDRLCALVRINLGAPLLLARELAARRRARPARGPDGTAVVINLLDQKLFNMNPDYWSYTLSKAALQTATTLLAQALAPEVRVAGIAPGLTLPSGDQSAAEFERAHRATPLGRSSRPEDIAAAVVFLLQSPAITGSTLIVDGGQHLVPTERDIMFIAKP